MQTMRVGIDFDNTIVSYDSLFHSIATERGLVPLDTPPSKERVRDAFRDSGIEEAWTLLQGEVYGTRMKEVHPFAGVTEFVRGAATTGHQISIISHKTKVPYLGPPHDLHGAASRWIVDHFDDLLRSGSLRFFFELTKAEKIARIESEQCDVYIDDLPEILLDPAWPSRCHRVHFDPTRSTPVDNRLRHLRSWSDAAELISHL